MHTYICTYTTTLCVCACMRGFLWVGRVFNGWKAFAPCSRCLPQAPPPPPLLPHWSLCCHWPSSGERVDYTAFISSTASNSVRKQKEMIVADLTWSVKRNYFTVNSGLVHPISHITPVIIVVHIKFKHKFLTYITVQCARFSSIYFWEYRLE